MSSHTSVLLTFVLVLATGGIAVVAAQSVKKSVMTSMAFEWTSVESKRNANGSGRKFFEGPSPTLDMVECHATTLNPGASNHEILERPHDEVIIIKEGNVEAYIVDKWVKLGPGSVIFNAANVPQAMRNVSTEPATYHVVMMRPYESSSLKGK